MKNVILFILCVLVMACANTKKSTQSKETVSVAADKTEIQNTNSNKLIDTTKTKQGKTTITEIEFFPLTVGKVPKESNKNDLGVKPKKRKSRNASNISLPNIGNIGGSAIKSIKQTTIEDKEENKGKIKESLSNEHFKNEATLVNSENIVNSEAEPAPDPYRWRYIFYILLLIVIVFLYLKRIPVFDWIKKILTAIWSVF